MGEAPAAPPADRAAPPRAFGYDIHGEVARGGQGVIYRATQGATGRAVAIKALDPAISETSRRARERLSREIRIAGSLSHPGIVRVFDSIKLSDGRDALVMELIDGEPLGVWAGRRPAPDERVRLELLARVADAVHHAHQHGAIHRDLKPSNILVDPHGAPRVLDFGVARRTGVGELDPAVTRTGEFSGTLAYAAPEQVSGASDAPDVRTDIYALGVIGFELLTGDPPHESGGSLHDVVERILTRDPPSSAATGISRDAWTVLAKATSKDKARRYQSAADLARDLRHAASGEAVLARGDSRWYTIRKSARRHRFGLSIAALAFLGLSGVLLSLAVGNERLTQALRESRLLQIRAQLAVGNRERAEGVFWAEAERDLRHDLDAPAAIWSGARREKELLWAFLEMQATATCLDTVPDAFTPELGVWATGDGTVLAALRDRSLVRMDPADIGSASPTGARIPVDARTVKVVPSGRFVVCLGSGRLWTLDADGGGPVAEIALATEDFSRFGLSVAEWGLAINDDDGALRVLDLPGLEEIYSTDVDPAPQTPWLDPERRVVAYIADGGAMRVVDLERAAEVDPSGAPVLGRERLGPNPQLLLDRRRGRVAVAYGGGMTVRDVSRGSDPTPLLSHPGYRVWVSADPGWGTISAVSSGDPTLHLWDTATWRPLDGLPGHHGSVVSHAFSPDASRIFTLDAAGTLRAWAAPGRSWRRSLGDGTAMAHQLAADPETGACFACDDAGRLIRFDAGGAPEPIDGEPGATRAALSVDSSRLAWCDMGRRVRIGAADGRGPVRELSLDRTESIAGLRFRPGGGGAELGAAVNPGALLLIDADAGVVRRSVEIPSDAAASDLAWSDDGAVAAVSLRDGAVAVLDDPERGAFELLDIDGEQVRAVAFLPGTTRLAAVGDSGVLRVVDVATGRVRSSGRLSEHSLFCVLVHGACGVALVGDRAGMVKAIDLADLTELASFDAGGSVMSMSMTERGRSVAVSALDRPVQVWRFADLAGTFDALRRAASTRR